MLLKHCLRLVRFTLFLFHFQYEAFKDWVETHRRRRRIKATRAANIPAALPPQRPRALTNSDTRGSQHDQNCSSLFAKLPIEIRLHIYKLVLATPRIIHIAVWNKKYWHRLCKYHPTTVVLGAGYLHGCWAEPRIPGDENLHRNGDILRLRMDQRTDDNLLALPLSCSRIYAESIDLLYSENIFNVHRAGTIANLPRSLRPQRLQHVRQLELDIPISRFLSGASSNVVVHPDDAGQWKAACGVLSKMKGLRSLTVSLSIQGLHNWSSSVVHYYVRPLMDVRVPKFVVFLPRVVGRAELAGLGDLPFEVVYHEDEDEPSLKVLQQELIGAFSSEG